MDDTAGDEGVARSAAGNGRAAVAIYVEAQGGGGGGGSATRTERGAQRGAGRAPARERAERGVQLRGADATTAERGRGGRAREEDGEHGAAARTRRGQGADAKDDTDGRAGRESGGRHRGERNRDMTGDHNNPTRAWSRNTIHPLFPLGSLGAGIIIGAGPGGRCSLRAPRRLGKQASAAAAERHGRQPPLPGAGTVTER